LHGEHVLAGDGLTRAGCLDLQKSFLFSTLPVFAIPEFFTDLAVELVFVDLIHPRPHGCQALVKRGEASLTFSFQSVDAGAERSDDLVGNSLRDGNPFEDCP
jgi:hypothetical protein